MKELTAREVQLGELSVLKKLDEICRAQNLKYFLFYGTLLGAVRHQGFIPWDDDVDVAMPREDYEKLLRYLFDHARELLPYKAMSHRNNKDYIYPICRFCDTRYHVDYQGAAEYGLGLFVDIYPFDGYGNTEREKAALYRKNWLLNRLAFQAGMKSFQKSGTAGWRTPIKFLIYRYAKLLGCPRLLEKMDRDARKRSFREDKFVDCVVWMPTPNGYPRELFDETAYIRFEDQDFPVPAQYDRLLTLRYGDYMRLPPEEQRIAHHCYTAYLLDEEEQKQRNA